MHNGAHIVTHIHVQLFLVSAYKLSVEGEDITENFSHFLWLFYFVWKL
jgi:hypothetical protein